MKHVLSVLFLLFLFVLLFPKSILAQVVINEFVPNSSTEWIELYNSSADAEYLKTYYIDDDTDFVNDSGSGPKKLLSSLNITNPTYPIFETSGFLNNTGDYVVIFSDMGNIINQYQYTSDPGSGISIGRVPDGDGNFFILSLATKGYANSDMTPTSTPTVSPITETPTPTQTSTPTPTTTVTPTSSKSTYKINSVKDSDGAVISNIKIYVDGNYTHHYAPETITFCTGCHCDDSNSVSCELGPHTIKLVKESYADWSEQKTFNPGDNFEVNPILSKTTADNTPTSTPTTTTTPTKSPTPKTSSPTPKVSSPPTITITSPPESTFSQVLSITTESAKIAPTPEIINPSSSVSDKNLFLVGVSVFSVSGGLLYFRLKNL